MRDAFISELTTIAEVDPSVFLIIGDLGYGVVDEFAAKFPERFLNAGVAEQSMMSLAAGISSAGYRVFVYSIANFPTMRCLEQIRNDVAYHRKNVTIVSVGAGLGYGTLGYTHHAVEDIAVMRAIPGLRVLSGADPSDARRLARRAVELKGPSYVRLGKNGEPSLIPDSQVAHASWQVVREGTGLTILSTGAILDRAIEAHDRLTEEGISVQLINISEIKPFPHEALEAAAKTSAVVTLEEHSVVGGFGSAVLEAITHLPQPVRVHNIGIPEDRLGKYVGDQQYLRDHSGLSSDEIYNACRKLI